MVRNYKRKTEDRWSEEKLREALTRMNSGLKLRDAVVMYGISRATLYRQNMRFKRLGESWCKASGGRSILQKVEENVLAKVILDLREKGFCVKADNIKRICFEYCEANNIPTKWTKDKRMASDDWYYGYIKRHPEVRPETGREGKDKEKSGGSSSVGPGKSVGQAKKTANNMKTLISKITRSASGKGKAAAPATKKSSRKASTGTGIATRSQNKNLLPYGASMPEIGGSGDDVQKSEEAVSDQLTVESNQSKETDEPMEDAVGMEDDDAEENEVEEMDEKKGNESTDSEVDKESEVEEEMDEEEGSDSTDSEVDKESEVEEEMDEEEGNESTDSELDEESDGTGDVGNGKIEEEDPEFEKDVQDLYLKCVRLMMP